MTQNRPVDANAIQDIGDEALRRIRQVIPEEAAHRTFLLLEMQRCLDLSFIVTSVSGPCEFGRQHSMLIWGMNLATAELLPSLRECGIPMSESSADSKITATNLLRQFGVAALLRRSAEMIRLGMMEITRVDKDGSLNLRCTDQFSLHILDAMEEGQWRDLEESWTSEAHPSHGWTIIPYSETDEHSDSLGAYWRCSREPRTEWDRESIFRTMASLVRPWETPYGTFIQYDAAPLVDSYFIDRADLYLEELFSQGGIHPSTDFELFTGHDLLKVLVFLVGVYQKHVKFCLIAVEARPQLDLAACLTLWEPRQKLLEAVAAAASLSADVVSSVIDYLTVSAKDSDRLLREMTPVRPMFIDLGNGMIIRPTSSLGANPLSQFKMISNWRNASSINAISKRRESWLRDDLFSLFGGRRYVCVSGGIVIKQGGRILTDIDAAIFDRATGELALFQLKWQDYDTDNVRQRASRAKNFADEVDTWGNTVGAWLLSEGPLGIAQAMRLNAKKGELPTSCFLFALSRSVARTHAYGRPITSAWISACTWPQLRRLRSQIGPARRVFSRLHEVLREEEAKSCEGCEPCDYVTQLWDGRRITFSGLWRERVDVSG